MEGAVNYIPMFWGVFSFIIPFIQFILQLITIVLLYKILKKLK